MGLEVVPGKGAPFDPNVRAVHASSSAETCPAGRDISHGICTPAAAQLRLSCSMLRHEGSGAGRVHGSRCAPQVHDAIMRAPSDEVPDGTVLQEFRKGFRIGSTLLRPAMVQVSSPAVAHRLHSMQCNTVAVLRRLLRFYKLIARHRTFICGLSTLSVVGDGCSKNVIPAGRHAGVFPGR